MGSEEERIMEERLKDFMELMSSMKSSVDNLNTKITDMDRRIDSLQTQIAPKTPTTTPTEVRTTTQQPQNEAETAAPTIVNSRNLCYTSGRRDLIDLPPFSGDSNDWPSFICEFEDTTSIEGYSTLQNNSRLKKCLTGKARTCVDSMLIHHQNVPEVIERLRTRFGSSEKIIRTQIELVKSVVPMGENRMDLLVPFADIVNNMKNVLKSCNSEHCLTN